MARRKLPQCNAPNCDAEGWEYTITSNEGISEVDLCDDHAAPLNRAARYGRFTHRKGKRRRRFDDLMYEQ